MAGDISRINGAKHIALADSPAVVRMREITERVAEARWEEMVTAQMNAAISSGPLGEPNTTAAKFIADLVIPKKVEVKHSGGIGILHLVKSLEDPSEQEESYGTE